MRRVLVAVLVVATAVVVAPGAAADRPPYDEELGRTPYQPDKMLLDPIPGDAAGDENRFGFNLSEYRGLENPAYYELLDRYHVKLYRNLRGLPDSNPKVRKEDYWLKAMDRFLPKMLEELNKWSGGRLRHKEYDRQDYLDAEHPDGEIAITFDPDLTGAKGRAYPGTRLDQRGMVFTGGRVALLHTDAWQELFEDTDDGDREAMHQVALLVMHELGHMLGLNHYGAKFHGEFGLMSSRRQVDDVDGWGSVLARGDKAGLLAIAGWRDHARDCGRYGDCERVWDGGGVAWPPEPPDHRYDRERS
jgi:hypothetical protein